MNPNPPHAGAPRPRLAEGFAALRQNRLDIATALRDQWLATDRDDPEVRFYAAEVGPSPVNSRTRLATSRRPSPWRRASGRWC